MMRAEWRGVVLAESSDVVILEGNAYFPASAVRRDYLLDSTTHSVCPWKGQASYYSVRVGSEINEDAAWFYPEPKAAASRIAGRIAFWKGVAVREV
jgi:uncharacterized protein (DUF427 family)